MKYKDRRLIWVNKDFAIFIKHCSIDSHMSILDYTKKIATENIKLNNAVELQKKKENIKWFRL